jgi:hypothetical protein
MKAYEVRRAERRRHQSDPGDPGWIVVCAIDGGPFVPLNPSWEYDSEAAAQLEADRLNSLEPPPVYLRGGASGCGAAERLRIMVGRPCDAPQFPTIRSSGVWHQ